MKEKIRPKKHHDQAAIDDPEAQQYRGPLDNSNLASQTT